jgi:predicted DNA-binding protein
MTHEGRMQRGKEKIEKGISDIETEYYLANSKKEEIKPETKTKTKKKVKE